MGEGGLCEHYKRPCNSIICYLNSLRLYGVSACHRVELIAEESSIGIQTIICSRVSTFSTLRSRRSVA